MISYLICCFPGTHLVVLISPILYFKSNLQCIPFHLSVTGEALFILYSSFSKRWNLWKLKPMPTLTFEGLAEKFEECKGGDTPNGQALSYAVLWLLCVWVLVSIGRIRGLLITYFLWKWWVMFANMSFHMGCMYLKISFWIEWEVY